MNCTEWTKSFYTATHLLPEALWRSIFSLSPEERTLCEEIRLRAGRPLYVTIAHQNKQIFDAAGAAVTVTQKDLEETLMRITDSSLHTYLPQLMQGFFTTKHGHRIGVCGEAVYQNGTISTIRNIGSINLRIAKECKGIGESLLADRTRGESVLVVSPPGGGKTTLLRDLARLNSRKYRVAVVDERYELAACTDGKPRFDIGQCDVMSGGSKKESIEMLLRCMNPDIIVLDEITRDRDCDAVLEAQGCGCDFFVSAHGSDANDLLKRPIYRKLIRSGIFHHIITIEGAGDKRIYRQERGETYAKIIGSHSDRRHMFSYGSFYQPQAL